MRNITLAIFSEIDVVEGYNSAGINPALELAIYDVNKNDSVLPGFYVDYVLMDTKCNEGVAAAALAKMLQQPPQKIMVIGGGCSVSTQATAQTSPFFNLVQGLITLHELFKRSGIENIAYHTIDEGGELSDVQMQDLKNRDARIIIFDGYEQTLRKIMCKAYRFGMSGGKIVWMYFGWFNYDWMLINDTSCHADEIKAAAEHALTLKEIMTFEEFTKGRQTVNGQDYSTYERRYKEWPSYAEYGLNEYHAYGYDAIWAAVLAMHSAMPIIAQQNVTEIIDGEVVTRPKRLDDFTYEDSHMLQVFMKELDKTNFTGMTGPMMFYENGSRPWQLEVAQVQGSVQVVVGRYNEITRKIYINDSMLKWLGGKVPPDHTPVVVTTSYVNALLAVVITSLAGVGVLVGLSLLGFNVMFREHRHIKLSSPNLNNVIVSGCIVAFCCVPFAALDTRLVPAESMPIICMLSGWLLSIAFSLAFGAMFAKTWRVYVIFGNKSGRPLHDKHLLLWVAILVMVDVAVMASWALIDPMKLGSENDTATENEEERLVVRHEFCVSELMTYWIGGLFAEKVLLLLLGCFLAFETRKVYVPELNDSKYLGMCIYNTCVLCGVGAAVGMIMSERPSIAFAFSTISIITSAAMTLGLLFVPKINFVRRDPTGELGQGESSTFNASLKNAVKEMPSCSSITDKSDIGGNSTTANPISSNSRPSAKRNFSDKKSSKSQRSDPVETIYVLNPLDAMRMLNPSLSLSSTVDMTVTSGYAGSVPGSGLVEKTRSSPLNDACSSTMSITLNRHVQTYTADAPSTGFGNLETIHEESRI
ncbi:gamma-aminobutyric acid type B receptor subunit 2 [Lingula anatina]|uniref:Gamma-aminobutyric acid type B receptor subunit 2 n=1 Tax=Lingula anatina TaxID=7574 RepID=A0A1S3KHM5_LINAN|nr:gamma-aminobutyric acid type B receptor subunit 2 [Lingula anatina]|eukprot:XP_013421726.1 gamma-aminobutyric acid type B receptor subunit 2 [Lingula anatina]